jgi:peptide/nickel transport system substrate-binding protein
VSPAYDKTLLQTNGFDLNAAKTGIESCSSRTATALVQPTAGILPTMQIIQADLKTIGFDLKIQRVDQATWLTKFSSADYQLTINGTTNAYRSASALTRTGVMSNGLAPKDFVDAIAQAQSAGTPDQVAAANKEINSILTDEEWAIGINTRTELFVMDNKVGDFVRSPAGRPVLTGTYLK